MLEFEHVTKMIKNTEILTDVSMTIEDGEFIVFIGPSGCGKTTTLKMKIIARMEKYHHRFALRGQKN